MLNDLTREITRKRKAEELLAVVDKRPRNSFARVKSRAHAPQLPKRTSLQDVVTELPLAIRDRVEGLFEDDVGARGGKRVDARCPLEF